MSVLYILNVHERRGATRRIEIAVTPDGHEGDPLIETFDYGMDVPLPRVREEVIGLLNGKYHPDVETLPGEGMEFTI